MDESDEKKMINTNRPQVVDNFVTDSIFHIPWGHLRFIIDKCYKKMFH